MKKKNNKYGPYMSVDELKKRFFPKLFPAKLPLPNEEADVIAVALAEDLAKRVQKALK